jgi:hypothetical protein
MKNRFNEEFKMKKRMETGRQAGGLLLAAT